jgi:hypothetical protein
MGAVGCISTQINFTVSLTVCLACEVTQKAALAGCVWVDSNGEIGWQSPQPWACHGVDGTASLRWCQRRRNRGRTGDYSSSMQTGASIDDGGRQRPTVAMGPHSQLRLLILSIQQSTNILGNRLEVSIVKTRKSYH